MKFLEVRGKIFLAIATFLTIAMLTKYEVLPFMRSKIFLILDRAQGLWALLVKNEESCDVIRAGYSVLAKKAEEQNFLLNNAKILQKENIELKRMLSFRQGSEFFFISTSLITFINNIHSPMAMIKAGSSHGVRVGCPVLFEDKIIGEVIEVYKDYANIALLQSHKVRIPVITSQSLQHGLLIGQNNKNMKLIYVSSSNQVNLGESLLTSSDSLKYPPGIVVAKITDIKKNEIFAQSLIDTTKVIFVNVILRK